MCRRYIISITPDKKIFDFRSLGTANLAVHASQRDATSGGMPCPASLPSKPKTRKSLISAVRDSKPPDHAPPRDTITTSRARAMGNHYTGGKEKNYALFCLETVKIYKRADTTKCQPYFFFNSPEKFIGHK